MYVSVGKALKSPEAEESVWCCPFSADLETGVSRMHLGNCSETERKSPKATHFRGRVKSWRDDFFIFAIPPGLWEDQP